MILWALARLRPHRSVTAAGNHPVFVSILICAFNEETLIARKLRNCLELEYPADRMEILVGSDASTDGTDSIIRSFSDPRIRLIRYEPQSGKTVVQNRLLAYAKGDIILFTDVDSFLTPSSLRLMAARLIDPKVAVVNPKYFRVNKEGNVAESFYDRWEGKIKELEGRLGAMVGCNAYANMVRREVAEPIPQDTNLDDFVLGIRPFRSGYDVVTEPNALVVTQAECGKLEFKRKARISRGNIQALFRFGDLLHPKYGIKAWTYFSHKLIRILIPFLLLFMLAASAFLLSVPFYAAIFVLQLALLTSIPLWLLAKGRWGELPIPQYYYYMNMALLVGYWQFFFTRETYWTKTPRN
jgi:cellulose synthase/poly-beta-1,6-N-acetylglucosamine synthase-like glycosyltransferase